MSTPLCPACDPSHTLHQEPSREREKYQSVPSSVHQWQVCRNCEHDLIYKHKLTVSEATKQISHLQYKEVFENIEWTRAWACLISCYTALTSGIQLKEGGTLTVGSIPQLSSTTISFPIPASKICPNKYFNILVSCGSRSLLVRLMVGNQFELCRWC